MAPTNLIINGDFSQGATGWSGTDIEAGAPEWAYLNNGSTNEVAEVDGSNSAVSVMEQTFTVTQIHSGELTLDTALRIKANPNAGLEGFTVEVLDSGGGVIASATLLPTANVLTSFSMPVDFPAAGDYTLRLTEVGPNDSYGAIVDNIALMVCFGGGASISTLGGEIPAREITPGMLIETASGPQEVRWVGRRMVGAAELAADPKLRPVKISAGALGIGLPRRDLWVSRQHRMVMRAPATHRMFDADQVLVSAIQMTGFPGIYLDQSVREIDYVHILFDAHEVVFAEGAPSESLYCGDEAMRALSPEARDEINRIFPELNGCAPRACAEAPILARHAANRMIDRMLRKGQKPLNGI